MDVHAEDFLSVSVLLTGFERVELQGTGMLAEYYERVCTATNPLQLQHLWTVARELERLQEYRNNMEDLDSDIQRLIMDDKELSPLAKNIIKLWYRGDWPDNTVPFNAAYTSARSYQEGLMWKAIGAHAPGAKQPGFGSWSIPPRRLTRN